MDGSEVLDLPDDRGSCKAISKPRKSCEVVTS